MNKIKEILILLRDLPKTIYFNFKIFDFNVAIKLPIRIKYNVKIGKLTKGSIEIPKKYNRFMIKLGYFGTEFVPSNRSYISIKNDGKLIFNGECNIAQGFSIFIDNGKLEIGKETYFNKNLLIQCEQKISIDKNALIGWNVSIRDTDGHFVQSNNSTNSYQEQVIIGKDTWLAADSTILKGSIISNGSIVGCNSLVAGYKCIEDNTLIVGVSAKPKKTNILLRK